MDYNDKELEHIIAGIIDSIQSKELHPVEAAMILVDLGFDVEDATDIVVEILEQSGIPLVENDRAADKSRADAVYVSDVIVHRINDYFRLSSSAIKALRKEGQLIISEILEACYNKTIEVDEAVKEITTIAYEYDDSKTISKERKTEFMNTIARYAKNPKEANPADPSALNK